MVESVNSLLLQQCKQVLDTTLRGKISKSKKSSDDHMRTSFLSIIELPIDQLAYPQYSILIPNLISLSEIREKLEESSPSCYVSAILFAIDFRRVISNFLHFNWTKDMTNFRTEARNILFLFEEAFEKEFPQICTVS